MKDKRRILVLAPHTDDGEFGCGGTLARFVAQGRQVARDLVFLPSGDDLHQQTERDDPPSPRAFHRRPPGSGTAFSLPPPAPRVRDCLQPSLTKDGTRNPR